jgi:hypothetical protein
MLVLHDKVVGFAQSRECSPVEDIEEHHIGAVDRMGAADHIGAGPGGPGGCSIDSRTF